MHDPDHKYWLALNEFHKFGPQAFARLAAYFPTMQQAFYAPAEKLTKAGIPPSITTNFIHLRQNINPDTILPTLNKRQISTIKITDPEYPTLLRQIHDPPPVLYYTGTLPDPDAIHISVVGSRKCTAYGKQVTEELIPPLAKTDLIITSGLAYGIDEAAHTATVKAGGITCAILAGGHSSLTTRGRHLAKKITESGGAVITEFPYKTASLKHFFPYRNRIISGLAKGLLVVEATESSGTLITARCALDQNRDVFAIPGPITSKNSIGTNNLLKMGATPTTSADDILQTLGIDKILEPKIYTPASKEEHLILEILSKTPVHIDELIRQTTLTPAKIAGSLSLMEMKGRTKHIGGMYYILT